MALYAIRIMSLALLKSRALAGMQAPEVIVEVHLANGLPAFTLVGLPDMEVREARDRVRAALQTSQFEFPQRRITVNLAPADLPKEGGCFDLPIALGILAASGQIPADALAGYEFAGELSLTGALRPVRGALEAFLDRVRSHACGVRGYGCGTHGQNKKAPSVSGGASLCSRSPTVRRCSVRDATSLLASGPTPVREVLPREESR